MPQWIIHILHTVQSTVFSVYFVLSDFRDTALAFDHDLWVLSRMLSAAIYIAIAAAALFVCYMLFRHRKK